MHPHRTCTIGTCANPYFSTGRCHSHYRIWEREKRVARQVAALDYEGWRKVPDYDWLEAHESGLIRSVRQGGAPGAKRGRILCASFNPFTGYCAIKPRLNKKRLCLAVHRLVAKAFHGLPPTETHEANHKNGIKTDNRADNLEWLTPQENTAHAMATGLFKVNQKRRIAERQG